MNRPMRAVLITGALGLEVVLQRTYHLLPPLSPRGFVVWDAVHVFFGVVVLPLGLALLLAWWGVGRPLRTWRLMDVLLFVYGFAVLTVVVSEVGFWVQETLLPLPRPVWRTLLRSSSYWMSPLLLLLVSAAAYVAVTRFVTMRKPHG